MIQSIERAALLLNQVSLHPEGVGVRELARTTALKVPTAQNILKTLASLGFLEIDAETRRYRIGLTPVLLAERVEPLSRLRRLSRPLLEALHADLGESITVCTMLRGRVLVVDSLVSRAPLAALESNPVVEHPHLMASGQVILAHCDRAFQEAYARREPLATLQPKAPATPRRLLALLQAVSAQGYAEAIDVRASGVAAVAVPVYGPGKVLAMTLGCSAPLTRCGTSRRVAFRRRLLQAAKSLHLELAGTADRGGG